MNIYSISAAKEESQQSCLQQRSHGMPYEEIRKLFRDVDRKEVEFPIRDNKEYSGIYFFKKRIRIK